MLNKLNKKKEEGFTIIEVLIVLAIAGLILVVVLIAIPQLQRNQRNTARQNDASRVASSVSNWVANNNGAIPVSGDLPDIVDDLGSLSQYELPVDLDMADASTGNIAGDNVVSSITIVTTGRCYNPDSDTGGERGDVLEGTPRQFAIQYATETSSGGTTGTPACLDV